MQISTSILERVLDLATYIQQIPAATFHEKQRAEFVMNAWKDAGMQDAWIDKTGNVYACLPGKRKKTGIVISAHLDTVFPVEMDLTLRRENGRIFGPGIGDNSVGLAGLFGIFWQLGEISNEGSKPPLLEDDLWLVANVCEEGLGDLKGMKAVVDYFGKDPVAYIVLEGMSLGHIYHRGLGVRRYRVSVETNGGHSWIDYGDPSAIHELAELIVKIKDIHVPVKPRTSINFGTIKGGTSVNTIAADASCELDLRSENLLGLNYVVDKVMDLVAEADQKGGRGVHVQAELIGERPTGEIPIHHPLVKLAIDCHEKNGIKTKLNIGSTDANIPLSQGLPAICMGLTIGGGAHTRNEYIETQPLRHGLGTLVDIIRVLDKTGL
jgi:tripeptide aminopeptidase